jgi:hypothetical protein
MNAKTDDGLKEERPMGAGMVLFSPADEGLKLWPEA